jgi:hypothetical protein
MLSNSQTWYPIVGRFAMIHVGFSNNLHEITDEHVGIDFFDDQEELKADIPAVCSRFKLGGDAYTKKALAYVLEKINNYPQVDLGRAKKAQARRKQGLLRVLTIEEGREPLP